MLFHLIALSAAAAGSQLVSAQSLGGLNISQSCVSALTGVITSSDASCLNTGALLSLATQSQSASVVPVINTWLSGLCSMGACSNSTLTSITNNITSGCASDLGVNSGDASSITPLILQFYPAVRNIVCLKNGNTLCPTQILNSVQSALGQNISLSTIGNIISTVEGNGGSAINSTVTCSDCFKQSYNILNQAYPISSVTSYFSNTCGSSFVNGQQPSSITQSAGQSSSGSGSGSGSSGGALGQFSNAGGAQLILMILSFGLLA